MLDITTIEVSPFAQNARILACTNSHEAIVVDPGSDAEAIWERIQEKGFKLNAIWLTHAHLDHAGGVAALLRLCKVPLFAHPDEQFMRSSIVAVSQMYGVPEGTFENCPEPENFIKGGETLTLGEYTFKTLYTPGHSPGHISFYCASEQIVVAGDVLFSGSIGRTDLPGGNYDQLIKSVRSQLFVLPAATKVLAGHGPDTFIGEEIRSNPFFV